MIKASRNQLGNVFNRFQGKTKKVLCVCSAGLLRSPTMANVLHKEFRYNTRACGSEKEFALIPISEALLEWADEVVFVSIENFTSLDEEEMDIAYPKKIVLDIPDEFNWGDAQLEEIILEQYKRYKQLQ